MKHWKVLPGSFDSHIHLRTMRRKGLDTDEILTRFFSEGGDFVLDIGTQESGDEERLEYAQRFPGRIFLSMGIHPTSLPENPGNDLRKMFSRLPRPEVIAWGEIGLDYYHKNVSPDHQKRWLHSQLEYAEEAGLPVIIHNREADADLFAILDQHRLPQGGILHCFSSGRDEARKALDKGFILGINGNATYKGSEAIREAILYTPCDRMVPDTDAPYLSPVPARGKPNHPGHVHLIYKCIAEIKEISPEEAVAASRMAWKEIFPAIRGKEE